MKPNLTEPALTLSKSAFYRLISQGVVVDGRAGGLVVGRTIVDGGIGVIVQRGESFHLQYDRVENGDFVLHPGLKPPKLNCRRRAPGASVFSHLLITDAQPDDKILWITADQEIVPEAQATANLSVLVDANTQTNPFLHCDIEEVFGEIEPA